MGKERTMTVQKVIAALVAVIAGTALARSADDAVFSFSTRGVDTYADGSAVLDGECYALVWVAAGHEFGGFYADCRLKDESGTAVLAVAPLASGGRCPPVTFQITGGAKAKIDAVSASSGDGEYEVYLLDTRVRDASGALVAGSVGADGKPTAVNGYAKVDASISTRKFSQSSARGGVPAGGPAMTAAALPPDCPVPVVSGFRVEGGKAVIKVSDTASYAQYSVIGAETPQSKDYEDVSVRRQGETGGGVEFEVPVSGGSRFFRVKCGVGL